MTILTFAQAGRQLARLVAEAVDAPPVVVAVSATGAMIANEVATALAAPLDILATVRLTVPGRPHSIFGAVTDGEVTLLPERIAALGLPSEYVDRLIEVVRREAHDRTEGWRGAAPALDVWGKPVVLVDDGHSETVAITTAASVLRLGGATEVMFAAPMASTELIRALGSTCPRLFLLQRSGGQAGQVFCGPTFPQATAPDVRAMVRRSRVSFAAAIDP